MLSRRTIVWLGAALVLGIPVLSQPPEKESVSPDRVVAEWALRLGGTVVLEGQRRPIADLDELPASDFRIRTLNLVGVTLGAWGLKDELSRIPALPHLKELYLNGRLWYDQPVTLVADTLALFSWATQLEKLVLSKPVQTYIPMEDAVLERVHAAPGIQELRLHQTRVAGDSLAPFQQLRYLDLSHNRFFDDRGLRHVARMRNLSKLYLRGTSVTDEGLRNLSGLRDLTELDLHGTGISDAGLAHLAGLTKLRRLNLLGSNATDAGLETLSGMTQLEELILYRTKVSNAGLARLARLESLRNLDVRYSRVTASGVKELQSSLSNLSVLYQDSSTRPAKRNADAASAVGKGEETIAGWLRSIGGQVRIRDGHVTAVSLASTSITDRELAVLGGLSHLEELSLKDTEISDIGVAHLSGIRTLRELDLSHTLLSDAALDKIGPLEDLVRLNLGNTLIEGPGLAALARLKDLRELSLSSSPVRDEGLKNLAVLTGRAPPAAKRRAATLRG